MKRLRVLFVLFICGFVLLGACSSRGGFENSSEFPSKQIIYSIPFDPGGQSDVEARRQQPFLEENLGQKVVIQYKPGGGGAVGWSDLSAAAPDGYFISGMNIPHIILQPLSNADTGYKTEDIVPVAIFQATPIGIAVSKESEIKTLDDLINQAKGNPGSITVAGSGSYSGHHIAFLQLQDKAGIEMQYIPFDGAAPSVQAFLGGNTEAIMANSSDLVKYADDMNILAIGSEKTFTPLPDVPTFKETGLDMTAGIDRGVAVPPGTSSDIIAVLEKAFLDILAEPGVLDEMYAEGFEPKTMGHEEAKQYIEDLTEEYSRILAEIEEK